MVKDLTKQPLIGIITRTYNIKCPFDMAQQMMDWLDGLRPNDIMDVVDEMEAVKGLNTFGKEVLGAIELMCGLRATNTGIPKETLAFYKRYGVWQKKHRR